MDELIQELQEAKTRLLKERDTFEVGSTDWRSAHSAAAAYAEAILMALKAKRRMAEREPAWDLQP